MDSEAVAGDGARGLFQPCGVEGPSEVFLDLVIALALGECDDFVVAKISIISRHLSMIEQKAEIEARAAGAGRCRFGVSVEVIHLQGQVHGFGDYEVTVHEGIEGEKALLVVIGVVERSPIGAPEIL